MRRNDYYALEMLNGVPYLLPFGQNIASHKRGFKLNDTGVFLWNHLGEADNEEELVDLLLKDEELTIDEDKAIREDLKAFIDVLRSNGVIQPDPLQLLPEVAKIRIAGVLVSIHGQTSYISSAFDAFRVFDDNKADLTVNVITGKKDINVGDRIVIRDKEIELYESKTEWHMRFPTFDHISFVSISKRLHYSEIFIRYEEESALLREHLFHVLRHIFLLKAQSLGYFCIHSASILYRGKAYLFSGPSGTGKSTHTAFWKKQYSVEYLNGDLNLISDEGTVYGIPWCGTSGIFTVKEYPLGGIVFLKQAKENKVEELKGDEKSLRISQRLISPSYNQELLEENLSFSVNLGKQFPCWRLSCTKDPSAAELMKETIDMLYRKVVL